MGYWTYRNGGGRNKTHESTASTLRRDSFAYSFMVKLGDEYLVFDGNRKIRFEWVKNNYGKDWSPRRLYFLCPECGRRVRFLYLMSDLHSWKCRMCGKLNYPSQQLTKNDDYHWKRIEKLLRKLEYSGNYDGFSITHITPPRPYYMHTSTYKKILVRLRRAQIALEEYQHETMIKMLGGVGKSKRH